MSFGSDNGQGKREPRAPIIGPNTTIAELSALIQEHNITVMFCMSGKYSINLSCGIWSREHKKNFVVGGFGRSLFDALAWPLTTCVDVARDPGNPKYFSKRKSKVAAESSAAGAQPVEAAPAYEVADEDLPF